MGVKTIYHEHNVNVCYREYMKDRYVGYKDYRQLILFIVNDHNTNFYVNIRYETFDYTNPREGVINTKDRIW